MSTHILLIIKFEISDLIPSLGGTMHSFFQQGKHAFCMYFCQCSASFFSYQHSATQNAWLQVSLLLAVTPSGILDALNWPKEKVKKKNQQNKMTTTCMKPSSFHTFFSHERNFAWCTFPLTTIPSISKGKGILSHLPLLH